MLSLTKTWQRKIRWQIRTISDTNDIAAFSVTLRRAASAIKRTNLYEMTNRVRLSLFDNESTKRNTTSRSHITLKRGRKGTKLYYIFEIRITNGCSLKFKPLIGFKVFDNMEWWELIICEARPEWNGSVRYCSTLFRSFEKGKIPCHTQTEPTVPRQLIGSRCSSTRTDQ